MSHQIAALIVRLEWSVPLPQQNPNDQFDPDVYAYLKIKASKVWATLGNDVSQTRSSAGVVQLQVCMLGN
eukprot:9108351-Pyramimonas_sp.AAC.1